MVSLDYVVFLETLVLRDHKVFQVQLVTQVFKEVEETRVDQVTMEPLVQEERLE